MKQGTQVYKSPKKTPVNIKNDISDKLSSYEGAATRTSQPVRLDLIPKAAITALGRRLKLGAERHGEHNWRSGGSEFRKATISHLMAHLVDYMENGNISEANTDAIICNAAFLCKFEEDNPYVPAFKQKVD